MQVRKLNCFLIFSNQLFLSEYFFQEGLKQNFIFVDLIIKYRRGNSFVVYFSLCVHQYIGK